MGVGEGKEVGLTTSQALMLPCKEDDAQNPQAFATCPPAPSSSLVIIPEPILPPSSSDQGPVQRKSRRSVILSHRPPLFPPPPPGCTSGAQGSASHHMLITAWGVSFWVRGKWVAPAHCQALLPGADGGDDAVWLLCASPGSFQPGAAAVALSFSSLSSFKNELYKPTFSL